MTVAARELLLKLWREGEGAGPVFPDHSAHNVSDRFGDAVRGAKIPDFHFHDLRHTFATRLAEAGTDAFTLAALLGHRQIQMTARYTHPTDASKRRAMAVLEQSRHNSVTTKVVELKENVR